MMNKLLSSTYIIPTVLFLFVHLFLISSLDLSDLPGASGTLDLHGAIQGSVQTSQIGWYWKQLHLRGIGWEDAVWSTSLAGVLLAFVGCLIAGNALEGKRGARTIGYLILFWPPIHFFGVVVGVDPLVFGLSWFAVSLFWIAFSVRWWGIVPMILGGYLLSHALTLKIFAAPMLLYAALSPLCIRRWHPSLWLTIPIWLLSLSIAVPDLGGEGDLRGGLRIPEVDWLPLAAGWYRLSRMMYLGMPEGKFDQILMVSFVVVILCRHRWKTRVPMVIVSGAILLVSTFILEEHLRTRLIAPAVFGSLLLLAVSISIRRWLRPLGLLILFGFFLELWTFVDLFAERRTQWAGAKEDPFPNAPLLWRSQYIENPILFKDLTLYGAVDA
ncbi:MAG: hypothetical protein VX278_12380, partial [Myxococcota bacterium]|nr:hypothetical protein [Myxococcota bacterium]